jgi:SAM-dependent methyltransferase
MGGSLKGTWQDHSTQTLFQKEWQIYRKVLDNNYFFHREVGDRLRNVIQDQANDAYSFLDIACGDASATVAALRGTAIAQYVGIDLSEAALSLARSALADLGCPFTLECADFIDALNTWSQPLDVVWIGLSLHHLTTHGKGAILRAIRQTLKPGGFLLIYENTSPDGEDRDGWLRRWDGMRSAWTAFDVDEWDSISAHVRAADFPETQSSWSQLGAEAGYVEVREVFRMPDDLFRMYMFAP